MGENFWKAWSHFPIILGWLVPLIAYLIGKEEETKFQAKQAFVWQLLGLILAVIAVALFMALAFLLKAMLLTFVGFLVAGIIGLIWLIYMLLGAYKTYKDEHFLYPFVGGLLGG